MKFDKNGNLAPQKIKFNIVRNEVDEETISKYFQKKTNFQINYDNEGYAIFVKKGENNKED